MKYNKTVHLRQLKIGDWVLRKVMGNTLVPGDGKLGPNRKGLYKVIGLAGNRASLRRYRQQGCSQAMEHDQSQTILFLAFS